MTGWREATLGEISDEVGGTIQTGPFGSQLHQADYADAGTPVVMPKDIFDGCIAAETVARISTEHVQRLSRHKLASGDIVYGRRGDIGRQALIRPEQSGWLCGTGCLRLSLGASVLDPLYLHYYLRQEHVVAWIRNQAIGATMPNLNTAILRSVRVRFPPAPRQREIAASLSAYDDLIENCRRRLKLLESMSRALYREWFVHFRYPGHESVPLVASPHGKLPEDWMVTELRKLCARGKGIQTGPFGSQLHQADYSSQGVPIVMPKDLIDFRISSDSIASIPEVVAERLSRYRVAEGDIVYGRRGDIGRRAFVTASQANWLCGTGCIRVRPEKGAVNGWYLFNYLGQDDVLSLIRGRAQGVTMPNLNEGVLASVPIRVPPRALQDDFARVTLPLEEQREVLVARIGALRRTRDLLLPRLLSGRVSPGHPEVEPEYV